MIYHYPIKVMAEGRVLQSLVIICLFFIIFERLHLQLSKEYKVDTMALECLYSAQILNAPLVFDRYALFLGPYLC